MTYLIDTDWVVSYLNGRAEAIEFLDSLGNNGLAVSLMTLGEVYEGIFFGPNTDVHEAGLERFLLAIQLIGFDDPTMRRFALLRGTLRRQGQLISDTDLLIAATALEHDLTVVTRNVRHFGRVPGLSLLT